MSWNAVACAQTRLRLPDLKILWTTKQSCVWTLNMECLTLAYVRAIETISEEKDRIVWES